MDAQRVVQEWVAALDRADLDGSMEHVSPDVEWSNPVATVQGAAELRELLEVFWTAVPDFQHTITQIVASDDIVACEGVGTGTNTGPLAAPSGARIESCGLPPGGLGGPHRQTRGGRSADRVPRR